MADEYTLQPREQTASPVFSPREYLESIQRLAGIALAEMDGGTGITRTRVTQLRQNAELLTPLRPI